MRILVIDDESFVLKVLVHQLKNIGYSDVVPYQSAHDALASLEAEKEPVRLIFLDLQMPEMDGVEFVRNLAKIDYAGGLVLVSGEDERTLQAAEKLAQAHRLKVLRTLRKPISPERLREVLESDLLRVATTPHAVRKYDRDVLRRAILGGELVNHYQPQVSIRSAAVVGVETLVRWQHPQDGLIYPDAFIHIAEENDLIEDLTRAVLTAAVGQAQSWRDAGIEVQVAVNVSMDNLKSLDFPDLVIRETNKAGFPAPNLMLEVTESRLMIDPRTPLDVLTRLRLKRVGLSLDDFGTGHSSLATLRDLPFDQLKVDRGFVHGACRDVARKAIVEASLGMGRQLAMMTVAEGVEDRADWDFLVSTGCDVAQGYFIARPMRAEAFPDWLSAWEARRGEFVGSAP